MITESEQVAHALDDAAKLVADQTRPLGLAPSPSPRCLGPARAGRIDQATAVLGQLGVSPVNLPHDAAVRLPTFLPKPLSRRRIAVFYSRQIRSLMR